MRHFTWVNTDILKKLKVTKTEVIQSSGPTMKDQSSSEENYGDKGQCPDNGINILEIILLPDFCRLYKSVTLFGKVEYDKGECTATHF